MRREKSRPCGHERLFLGLFCPLGRSGETRTRGLMVPNHARYQLRYTSKNTIIIRRYIRFVNRFFAILFYALIGTLPISALVFLYFGLFFILRLESYVRDDKSSAARGAGRTRGKPFKHVAHIRVVDERGFAVAYRAFLIKYIHALSFVFHGAYL